MLTTIEIELLCIVILLGILCLLHINRAKKCIGKLYRQTRAFLKRTFLEILFFALWILPRKKELVVFGSDFGFTGNPKYLFLEAQKYPELHCVWIAKDKAVCEKIKDLGYEAYTVNSKIGRKMQRKAKTLIHSHSIKEDFSYLLTGGATSVNTWHGVGLKRSWFRNPNAFSGKWMSAEPSLRRNYHLLWARTNMARKNYVIGTSEEVNAYYPATYHVSPENVLNLGQARNDVFFVGNEEQELEFLPECFQNRKVILYMPTHRGYGEKRKKNEHVGSMIDYERLSEVLGQYGYTFVIKQHHFNTHAKSLKNNYPNIFDISNMNMSVDPQILLKHTDILITDYSSCYTDFLLLDRPVVFYCYDLEKYLKQWDLNFDYDNVTPGPKVFNSDELIAELEKLMRGEDAYEAERQRVKRVFYSPENQGPVAAKQMKYIIDNIIRR